MQKLVAGRVLLDPCTAAVAAIRRGLRQRYKHHMFAIVNICKTNTNEKIPRKGQSTK